MTDEINIMLVEDQPEYRDVIKLAIDKTSDLHLASMYGTAEKALSSMQRSLPDVILLDLRLLGMSGIEAMPKFRESSQAHLSLFLPTQTGRETFWLPFHMEPPGIC